MKIRNHIDSAELMSCASGSQPEAIGAVISTHLAMCPHCRSELKIHSLIGETLFQDIAQTPLASDQALKIPPKITPSPSPIQSQKLNEALRLVECSQKDSIAWTIVSPEISDYPLFLSEGSRGSLKLIRLAPKAKLPLFKSSGAQFLVLLEGTLQDNSDTKQKGDIVQISSEVPSSFVAGEKSGCVFLIGSDSEINF